MNHARNIKEMLSIPTGNRNVAASGYSSFTDSQLFFGSQFWPENSQGMSQDMSLSSRTSQHSSQEANDQKFLSSYHNKPLLFGDLRDKPRAFRILDKFDEDKTKAKERHDSDILAKEYQHIREALSDIQQLIAGTERNTAVCQAGLEKYDNFTSTLQNNLNSLQDDIAQQFQTLLTKVQSQKEVMTKLEERMQKSGDITSELGLKLQDLKKSMESLKDEQERERNMLEETLKLLSTLVSTPSAKPCPQGLADSAIQTSPGLEQSLLSMLQDNKLESTQVSHSPEHIKAVVPPHDPSLIMGKKRFKIHRRHKKRPPVLSHRRRHTVSNENSQPHAKRNKWQSVSTSECELNMDANLDSVSPDCVPALNRETRPSKTGGCYLTPLSCWSQDSNSSSSLTGFKPILGKLSAESKTGTPVKPDGFWQLFDLD